MKNKPIVYRGLKMSPRPLVSSAHTLHTSMCMDTMNLAIFPPSSEY